MIRRRRVIAIVGGLCGVVLILVVVLIATSSDSPKVVHGAPATAPATAIATTTAAVAPVTTTALAAATTTTALVSEPSTTDPSTTGPSTTGPPDTSTTTTVVATTIASAPPASPTASTVTKSGGSSGTSTAAGAPAAPVGPNCTYVGAISIAVSGVLQPILAEQKQFKDGLLCGNHTADHINQGVDILPGFAPFVDSVAGGVALQGQVPAIIFGHRNSHNHPFREINKLQSGDPVNITLVDGTSIDLVVSTVELKTLADATNSLLSPSADGSPEVRLVACSHADGTPGGVNYRWIATLVPKTN